MRRLPALALLLFFLAFVPGCLTIYGAAVGERDLKTVASDKTIEAKILERFVADETVKALDISASCYAGGVYLAGEYENAAQKDRAIEIARKVEGVKSVTTYLLSKKKDHPCGTAENLKITAKVKAKLIGDKDIWSTNVEVKTVQCNVVLMGIVGGRLEMDKSIAHAKAVEGVRGVKSFLRYSRGK